MTKLQLTDVERLLLANQYEILGALNDDADYKRIAQDLREGHKWIYEQTALRIADNLPDEDAQHVLTILGIYSDLRDSYNKLSDKTGIEEHEVTFPGFDGNNESELLHFAQALSNNGNYAETIGKQARNSHMQTTEMYRRQIAEWENLDKPQYPFSKEQILKIAAARRHPTQS